MRKIICCILILNILVGAVPVFAEEEVAYDYNFKERYTTYAREEKGESKVIVPAEYLSKVPRREREKMSRVYVDRIVLGGKEGRGVIGLRTLPSKKVTTIIECPTNPGDEDIDTRVVQHPFGKWQAFSLFADKGELYFKEMSGFIVMENGTEKTFIIKFPER